MPAGAMPRRRHAARRSDDDARAWLAAVAVVTGAPLLGVALGVALAATLGLL